MPHRGVNRLMPHRGVNRLMPHSVQCNVKSLPTLNLVMLPYPFSSATMALFHTFSYDTYTDLTMKWDKDT